MNTQPRFEWLAFFRLLRLPNVFTAWSDVLMGFLVAQGALPTTPAGIASIVLLLAATTGLYLGGMVLNDWFDYEEDKKARAFRPLPSGMFTLRFAATLGFGFLLFGVLFAASAGAIQQPFTFMPAALGAAIAIAVIAYNSFLKRTPIGPLGMGLCRFLNILLAVSVGSTANSSADLRFTTPQLLIALGIGVYIAGVTWFARREEAQSPRAGLIFGFAVMLGGIALVAFAPDYGPLPSGRLVGPQFKWLLLLVGGVVATRCLRAIADPSPGKVQISIKIAILTLIWLDAAIALRVAGIPEAVAIAILIIPALVIGRAVYST